MTPPFPGPSADDFQRQHLQDAPPTLQGINPRLTNLLSLMLRKIPVARPSLERVGKVLQSALEQSVTVTPGFARLASAGAVVAEREGNEEARLQSLRIEENERNELARAANRLLETHFDHLCARIVETTPSARRDKNSVRLAKAVLALRKIKSGALPNGSFRHSGWDVVAGAEIALRQEAPPYTRTSSLWYARLPNEKDYRWREVAYRMNPLAMRQDRDEPFALEDLDQADVACAKTIVGPIQIAFGPKCIDDEDAEDFYDRWAELLSKAALGYLP